jgi:hypothetical protein
VKANRIFGGAMTKKSDGGTPLKLVSPPPTDPRSTPTGGQPARKLGPHGQALWDKIKKAYDIRTQADRATLKLVCEAQDRLHGVEQRIKADGLMVMARNGPREHPLLRAEAQLRSYISRYLQRLVDPNERRAGPGRPGSGGVGITWRQLQGLDAPPTYLDDDEEKETDD